MKLPNVEAAVVPKSKIVDYLLSTTHPTGQSKAGFFSRFGFRVDNWQQLADALLKHAAENEVLKVEESPFGMRYVVEGSMLTPDGRTPLVRTVWFMDADEVAPRFVSAYPLKRKEDER
jgi:hypothetical protein